MYEWEILAHVILEERWREAEKRRLIERAVRTPSNPSTFPRLLLSKIGDKFVDIGSSLQDRYGQVEIQPAQQSCCDQAVL